MKITALFVLLTFSGCNSLFWKNLQPSLVACGRDVASSAIEDITPLVEKALQKENYKAELDKLQGMGVEALFCALQSLIGAGIAAGVMGSVDPGFAVDVLMSERAKAYLEYKGVKL